MPVVSSSAALDNSQPIAQATVKLLSTRQPSTNQESAEYIKLLHHQRTGLMGRLLLGNLAKEEKTSGSDSSIKYLL